jgi:O-antigen/teichoic acid export membrane protein
VTIKHRFELLLRRLEKYTKTDNVYLVKSGVYLVLNQGVNVLNGFLLYVLITHYLPKETYGQYKYLLSLFGLFAVTTFTGMDAALTRAIARDYDGSLGAAFRRRLLGGLVGSLISILIAGYYQWQGRQDLAIALVLLALFAPWIYAASSYTYYFIGKKEFKRFTRITAASTMLAFIGMAAAFIFVRDYVLLFLAFLITSLTILIGYLFARRERRNTNVDPDLMSYATHLSLLDLLGIVANSLDGVLVFHFLGPIQLAVYSLAIMPVAQLNGFFKTVQTMAMPKFAVNDLGLMRATIRHKLLLFMLAVTLGVVVYILLLPWFYGLFFPTYLASVPYSQVYSLSLIFLLPANLLASVFQAKGLRKETTLFNISNYSLQIILLLIGVWMYGLWGIIFSRMLARLLMLGTTHVMLQRAQPEPMTDPIVTP